MIKVLPHKKWFCHECNIHHEPMMDVAGNCFIKEWWSDHCRLEESEWFDIVARETELGTWKTWPEFTVTHGCGCVDQVSRDNVTFSTCFKCMQVDAEQRRY
jgi:hypothetical protein